MQPGNLKMVGKLLAKRQENTVTIAVKSGQFGSSPVEVCQPKSTVGICSLTILTLDLERKWKILFFDKGKQSVLCCFHCREVPSTLFYLFILVILKKSCI